MMLRAFIAAAIYFAAVGQSVTLNLLGGEYKVTFDPTQISEKELLHALQLSPEWSSYNNYSVPESLELCGADDPAYKSCGSHNPRSAYFFYNAHVNLEKIRARIVKLDESAYPPELSGIVKYLRQVQQFWLWREQQKLKFYQTRDVSELKVSYGEIDPKRECPHVVFEEIQQTRSVKKKYELVRGDWANCVWFAENRIIGNYPKQEWDAFLSRYKIHEQVSMEED